MRWSLPESGTLNTRSPRMTYPEALRYLDSFINYEKKDGYDYRESFKLERMAKICSLLGDPQEDINSIHIAGTKGKGSTCAMVHSILRSAGFRVGLYTSPHLISFTERIKINDTFISENDVARFLEKVKDIIEKMRGERPSFFEVYTALAYLYFKEKKTDFVVYEVGMGGRLDATNVITPLVTAITPISYEHMDKLGRSLRAIAAEKAGIIKNNTVCVVAPQKREALEAIERIAKKKNARLIKVGKDISFKELASNNELETFTISGLADEYPRLKMRLLGSHQVMNAATAIGIVESLGLSGITVTAEAIRKGIASAEWPGRLEIVGRKPYVILDGAQNRASAQALAEAIKKIFRYKKLILVLGVSKDKDIKGILAELLPISDSIILTKAKIVDRAMDPDKIKKLIKSRTKDVILTSSVREAMKKAKAEAGPKDLILITGSLFVVGEARKIIK